MPQRHPKAPGSREAFSAGRQVRCRASLSPDLSIREDREINAVFSKTLRVLGHAEFFKPVCNLLHRRAPTELAPSVLDQQSEVYHNCSTLRKGVARLIRVVFDRLRRVKANHAATAVQPFTTDALRRREPGE